MLQGYKYQSEFVLRYYNEGHKNGLSEGREEGLRAALLALAATRVAGFNDKDAAAIGTLRDERVLTDLVTALGQADSRSEARTAFDRIIENHRDR